MNECERIPRCPFFNNHLKNMPKAAEQMKLEYCRGNKNMCARYRVAAVLGPERVPGHLFPDMIDTAEFILDQSR